MEMSFNAIDTYRLICNGNASAIYIYIHMHRLDSPFAFWPFGKVGGRASQHGSLKLTFFVVRPKEPSENGLAKSENISCCIQL